MKYTYVIFFIILFIFIISFVQIDTMDNMNMTNSDINSIGFIITRHVKCENSNKIWIKCIQQIRKFYPLNTIVIIDDNSNYQFVIYDNSLLDNCIVIESSYKGAGELLPYYYYYTYKWFDKAIYIHDSVFINNTIDTKIQDIKFLWFFYGGEHEEAEQTAPRIEYLCQFLNNKDELLNVFKEKSKWKGCWGAMSVIDHNYLTHLVQKYNFLVLLQHMSSREDRKCFERFFGLLCCADKPELNDNPSIYGYYIENPNNRKDIYQYNYEQYMEDENNNNIKTDINKLFLGR